MLISLILGLLQLKTIFLIALKKNNLFVIKVAFQKFQIFIKVTFFVCNPVKYFVHDLHFWRHVEDDIDEFACIVPLKGKYNVISIYPPIILSEIK